MARTAAHRERLNRFLDHIADDGCSVSEASRRVGISQQNGSNIWQRVKRDMGEQAK